jgi:hypothetical protein
MPEALLDAPALVRQLLQCASALALWQEARKPRLGSLGGRGLLRAAF